MLGKIVGILFAVSLIFAMATGNLEATAQAAIQGAGAAITLILTLLGMMCLWCGIMRVAEKAGALKILSKLMSPLLRLLFPDAWAKKHGINEISASLSANILGIGNAATPLAMSAMKALADNNGGSDTASDDMVTFTVISTSSLDILPTTLIALRTAAGSADAFEIIVPIWICSAICALTAAALSRGLRKIRGK